MNENVNLGAYAVLYVVETKKNQVVSLLLKNGVVVPSNATDIQIALVVTNLLKLSKSFYEDFSELLIDEETVKGIFNNMSGGYSNVEGNSAFCNNTANKESSPNSYKLLCGDSTSTSTESTKDSSSWINRGLNLIQTGFQGYLQLDENKTKRTLANASVKLSDNETTKGELPPTKTPLSTGAIVGISILGVTVVGLVVYLIAKKR